MEILIVDCDEKRRDLLKQRIKSVAPSISIVATERFQSVAGMPSLVLCHVGDRQHKKEDGKLGDFLCEEIAKRDCLIAGFTGGRIADVFREIMPPQSDSFVVKYGASTNEVVESFGKVVDNLVRKWILAGGHFAPGQFAEVWLGVNPILEAKLCMLAALLEGDDGADYGRWSNDLSGTVGADASFGEGKLKTVAKMAAGERLKILRDFSSRLFPFE